MPPDDRQIGSAIDWLTRAKGDLAIAGSELPDGAFLEELTSNLKHNGKEIPPANEEATILTTFAWEARYPGIGEPVTSDEHEEAVAMATDIISGQKKSSQSLPNSFNIN